MKKISIYFFILLISIGSLISNYKVFNVNVQQIRLSNYLSSGSIASIDLEYLERISTDYPTLSQTVIPFKAITGTYWLQNDSVIKGLNLLEKANKENPYLGFPDSMLAGFYEFIGVKDSFNFYARNAYNKLPNAPQHYVLLSKVLINEDRIDSLEIFFNDIKERIKDKQVFKIYFASAVKNQEKFDSISLSENIQLSKSRFARDPDITLLTDYLVYGEEKVKNLTILKQQAIDSFNNKPDYSIKIMTEIIQQIYDNLDNYEVLLEMHFRNGDYKEVVDIYSFLNENNAVSLKAVIIEFIAISYVNLNDLKSGCSLALTLKNNNYNISSGLASRCNI